MSLLYFHAVLMGTAILFSFGLGVWETEQYFQTKNIWNGLTGIGSFAAAAILAVYLGWFVRKNFKSQS